MTIDIYIKKNIRKMAPASFQATCHFIYVFLCINIFRHTYISLYRFLYIF